MNPRFPLKCLIASWAFGLVGLLLGIFYKPEYFSRFGAIVVLLALMSEYALLKYELERLYQSLSGVENSGKSLLNLAPSKWHQKKALMSHITIVLGTFVWGFGDLWLQ